MGDEADSIPPQRKNQLAKIAAVIVPVFSLACCWLPMLSSEPGVLPFAVLNLLRQVFGYLVFLLPVFLLITGERVLVTAFWKPYPIAQLALGILGGTILFVSLAVFVHALILGMEPKGDLLVYPPYSRDPDPTRMWNEAVPTCGQEDSPTVQELESQGWVTTFASLDSMQLAQCGWGGGLIGAMIYGGGYRLLGGMIMFFLIIFGLGLGAILWMFSIIDQLRWSQPQTSTAL